MAQHCAYEDETNNVRNHIQLVNALCKKEEINAEINDDKRFFTRCAYCNDRII